ncbi:energy-coupling factor ABC transporter ATP-binding protein [Treponema sp. OMZ 788]|uniref:ABC transporter ATP-binding protein n=1 Tax=Treponema sp. OMZ 788 TaxID=2563664 RepID=UPI0020A5CBB9|nr:energy-coupling factor ABC transporter ATP-binding protein [Treponema sp. OMZ 788]UTC65103.1 energy-coupling factor ABC transporter ATP-binding protein [Treponema sp. OMZ 788]
MNTAVELKDVSFIYESSKDGKANLKKTSLNIKKGEFLLVTGISGCGKSTLTKCINGLIPRFYEGEFSGSVFINEEDVSNFSIDEISKDIGSVFQSPKSQFFTDDVISELSFPCENYGLSRDEIIERIAEVCSILHIENLLTEKLENLSNGQKQKAAVASILTLRPKIIVLDEPSSNLDFNSILILADILKILKQRGFTIIIAEHRLHYLKDLFDRVIYINEGNIQDEYTREEFLALENADLNSKGLRSLHLFKNENETEAISSITNKDLNDKFDSNKFNSYKEGEKICSLSDISFSFKDGTEILNSINLNLYKNDIAALTGKNGAGKTTLAKIISGIYRQSSGCIKFGEKILNEKERVSRTNFVLQDVEYQLFGADVFSELLIGNKQLENINEKIEKALKKLNLYDYKDEHPFSLSMGQKQRLIIAATYVRGCPLTILDEPTSGLDYGNMIRVGELIEEIAETSAVLIITHDFEFISKICNRLILLKDKKIALDSRLEKHDKKLESIFSTYL